MSTPPPSLEKIPYTPLLLPISPIIQSLARLTKHLASYTHPSPCPTLWIAREDLNSGLAFGGNKIRKLEYVIPDAVSNGADTLVTTGGIQSNHMRQTAAVAAKLGMKAVLVPKDMVKAEGASAYNAAGNVQINHLLGAETLPVGMSEEDAMAHVRRQGGKPYWIPAGASQHPNGGLGYTRWMFEVAEWEEQNGLFFDTIFVTAGGCSTIAGIVVGNKLMQKKAQQAGKVVKQRKIVGVGIFDKPEEDMVTTAIEIAKTTFQRLGLPPDELSEKDFTVDMGYNAGAYGRLDEKTRAAVQLVAKTEGVLLDPVYTGKAMAGLLDMVREGELAGAKNVLFVHTGGQAAISAYPQLK